MKKISKKISSTILSVIFMLLMASLLVFQQEFSEWKLKRNLVAFQRHDMETTVDNFITIIDKFRTDLEKNLLLMQIPYTQDDIKNAVVDYARQIVHSTNYANDSYIWINEIVNYDGGDNYAIRVVHGNLPDTEGLKLSTFLQDAKGDLPYLEELNGIKENGEIFYKYYFKEYRSEKISEKISYAKLYEPYDWIVCTGTYLNSLYNPAGGITRKDKIFFHSVSVIIYLIAIILLAYIFLKNKANSKRLMKEAELLKSKVSKDSMTGAGSRAFGSTLLHEYLNNFKKIGNNYSLAILDIDNFKHINDRYGHNVGDSAIKSLVNTIKSLQNENDHIIRWGGDEFILVYNSLLDDLEEKLEIINQKVSEQEIETETGEKIHYTISIGASSFNEKDEEISDTIKRVDDALYLAKRKKNTYYVI